MLNNLPVHVEVGNGKLDGAVVVVTTVLLFSVVAVDDVFVAGFEDVVVLGVVRMVVVVGA